MSNFIHIDAEAQDPLAAALFRLCRFSPHRSSESDPGAPSCRCLSWPRSSPMTAPNRTGSKLPKLSSLPPREFGRCEHALGNMLDWHLWIDEAPISNLPVDWSQDDGQFFSKSPASSKASMVASILTSSGFRCSATVCAGAFRSDTFIQDFFAHMLSV